jgi:hypothetical protein
MQTVRSRNLSPDVMLLAAGISMLAQHAVAWGSPDYLQNRWALQDAIMQGAAPVPFRYRVLVPLAISGIRRGLLGAGLDSAAAFKLAFLALTTIGIGGYLLGLRRWLREWTTDERATIGALAMAAAYPLIIWTYVPHPWHWVEAALTCYGLTAARRGQIGLALVLVVVSTATRETGVFLAVGGAILLGWRRGWCLSMASMVLAWLLVFLAVRWAVGPGSLLNTVAERMERNSQPTYWHRAFLMWLAFIGPALGLAVFQIARVHRRTGWRGGWRPVALVGIGIVYIVLMLRYTYWQELRMAAWIWLLPMCLTDGRGRKREKELLLEDRAAATTTRLEA